MANIASLIALNAQRWSHVAIQPERKAEVMLVARRLVANKERYKAVEAKTGVPWFIIACLHEREASGRFNKQLGQGDPLDHVSMHEPKRRGPFPTWEAGAYDALVLCPPFAARNKDWTVGGALTLTEQYNGLGPETVHHIPSGYVWGATNIEELGKYIADHDWSATTWDTQLGVAAIIIGMRALDPSIRFADEAAAIPQPEPEAAPKPKPPAPPQPAPQPAPQWGFFIGLIRTVLTALTKGK